MSYKSPIIPVNTATAAPGVSIFPAAEDHDHGISGSGLDHGLLTGLSDDDHAQYLLLAGRAGGQILAGGNAANDDLTLKSTTHATKTTSYILLQPDGGNVGIGQTAPVNLLHIGEAEAAIAGPGISFWSKANLTVVDAALPATGVVSQIYGKANNSGGGINLGMHAELQQFGTDDSAGASFAVLPRHTSGTILFAVGLASDIEITGAGNITTAAGLYTSASMWDSGGGVGTVDTLASLLVESNSKSAGTLLNNYGIFIHNQTGGNNNWNLYSEGGGLNYFGGQIQIAGGSPGAGRILASDADGLGSWTPNLTWSVLTNGDIDAPELIFAGGDVIMIAV